MDREAPFSWKTGLQRRQLLLPKDEILSPVTPCLLYMLHPLLRNRCQPDAAPHQPLSLHHSLVWKTIPLSGTTLRAASSPPWLEPAVPHAVLWRDPVSAGCSTVGGCLGRSPPCGFDEFYSCEHWHTRFCMDVGVHLGMEILGHIAAVSEFGGTATMLSPVAAPSYVASCQAHVFRRPHTLTSACAYWVVVVFLNILFIYLTAQAGGSGR